jgi:hypothetical protein
MRNGGQEDGDERDGRPRDAVRRLMPHGSEVSGECEQRPRHRLCCAVASHELLVGHPPRRDDLGLQERQDDMATSEDQRPHPKEAIEHDDCLVRHHLTKNRQHAEQREERDDRRDGGSAPDGRRQGYSLLAGRTTQ